MLGSVILLLWHIPSLMVVQDLQEAGTKTLKRPDLLLVVLPSSAADIRFAVKQFGDVFRGVSN